MTKYIATANSQSDLVTGIKLPVLCIFRTKYGVVYYVVPFIDDTYYEPNSTHYDLISPSQIVRLEKDMLIEIIYAVEDLLSSDNKRPYIHAIEFEKELMISD